MFEVRFVGTPGHFGPFTSQTTARWWAKHECDGKPFNVLELLPTCSTCGEDLHRPGHQPH